MHRVMATHITHVEDKSAATSVLSPDIHSHYKSSPGWSSRHGAAEMNPTRNHEVVGLCPGLTQWVKDPELL